MEILKDFDLEKYDYLALELLEYCERRECTFDLNTWNKIIFMIKCITNFNVSELENLGDKLLNEMKIKYKNLATVDQFSGFPGLGLKVKKVKKGPKPWNKKSYQNCFYIHEYSRFYYVY